MPGRGCAGRDGGPRPGWTRAAGPRRAAGSWHLGWQAATRSDGPAQVAGVAGCRERGRGGPCVLGGKGPWKRTEPPGWRRSRPGLGVRAAGGSYVVHRMSHSHRKIHLSSAFHEVLTWAAANTAAHIATATPEGGFGAGRVEARAERDLGLRSHVRAESRAGEKENAARPAGTPVTSSEASQGPRPGGGGLAGPTAATSLHLTPWPEPKNLRTRGQKGQPIHAWSWGLAPAWGGPGVARSPRARTPAHQQCGTSALKSRPWLFWER